MDTSEGNQVEICASFSDQPFERDVSLSFTVDLLSATGMQ